jgi:transposase
MEQALAQRNRGVSLKPGKSRAALTITHPNAAGIDIGSASHFVAVPLIESLLEDPKLDSM